MNLSFFISPNCKALTIIADDDARAELRELTAELGDDFNTERTMHEVFENLVCNSELQWVAPETCGDLTEAPILGIWGPDYWVKEHRDGDGTVRCGGDSRRADGFTVNVCDVVERWGYMPYQMRSPLRDLRDTGKAVFVAP